MGLLDDLRHQAGKQRLGEEEDAARQAEREAFYREQIMPLMHKAFQYYTELIEHLNYIKPDTTVNYPLLPDGQPMPLKQGEYTIVIDSSKELKQIDIKFECNLNQPIDFEIVGKEAILRHADRLDRYRFKYQRVDKKDNQYELESAKFKLEGPMPLYMGILADIGQSRINILLRNFTDPGMLRYTLTPEQFNEEFMDRLGRFILRQEKNLFTSNMSEDARAEIRRKLEEERLQKEQEMAEREAELKAIEEEELSNTNKEKLKRAMQENSDKLKGLYHKLKGQVKSKFDKP
jgi:hypothetical protein